MITVTQNLNNNDLLALFKKVETEGERIIIETENKGKVALINYHDLKLLEDLEDARDVELLKQAIAQSARCANAESTGEFLTLEEVLAERGLTLEYIMNEEF